MDKHHENLDELLEQFKVNCHRTLDEFLKYSPSQMSDRVTNPENLWLARFIIAFEGCQETKISDWEIAQAYSDFHCFMTPY